MTSDFPCDISKISVVQKSFRLLFMASNHLFDVFFTLKNLLRFLYVLKLEMQCELFKLIKKGSSKVQQFRLREFYNVSGGGEANSMVEYI